MFAVQQQNSANKPFNLNVENTMVREANGGVAFSNVGGVLRMDNVQIIESTLIAAVSTGVAGMTVISGAMVTSSSIMVSDRVLNKPVWSGV